MKTIPIKRALLSVSNKSGIVEFAKELVSLGVQIISTGGTSETLRLAGIPFQPVEDLTQLPEMLEGRVKTLHPKIHAGILGKRDKHQLEASKHQISWIDLVVVNFYPFEEQINSLSLKSWEEVVEYIDIGGPTMVRAAAKNFAWVGVIVDPMDYEPILTELREQGGLQSETRQHLAHKAFALTQHYDAVIHNYFLSRSPEKKNDNLFSNLELEPPITLRYGENPHQTARAFRIKQEQSGILAAHQHQGKPLSYNNLLDADAAWLCAQEFEQPTCVLVKHANPCGVATAANIEEAYRRAYQADSVSAFGGIIALTETCTEAVAKEITQVFMEVVLAPGYTAEALSLFATKPNLRVLQVLKGQPVWEMKFITGGILWQEKDGEVLHSDDLKVMTSTLPGKEEVAAMLFAWRVLKHIKSNAILIAKEDATVGIGAGQVSRIDAVELAVRKAGEKIEGAILASDAFFPFRDSIDRIAKTGIRAIIQPGGSVRDEEVIAACNEHGIAMVFTGKRCFKH
jgi:phosphoribosylaminoimidazolecarboxamide formyltransferase/IMP cyclohydrolase